MFEYFAWLYVWTPWVSLRPKQVKKGPRDIELYIEISGYKLPSRCWELNPDPLQEKSMFLTSESLFAFFQSIIVYWVLCVLWCTCGGQESLREVSCLFLPGGSWGPNFMFPAWQQVLHPLALHLSMQGPYLHLIVFVGSYCSGMQSSVSSWTFTLSFFNKYIIWTCLVMFQIWVHYFFLTIVQLFPILLIKHYFWIFA